jgi:Fe-S-cluster containining protein
MSKTVPNCRECGVCCVAATEQLVFANVSADELVPLKRLLGAREFRKTVHETGAFDMLALTLSNQHVPAGAIKTKDLKDKQGALHCACTFLNGIVGSKVRCQIYKDRPNVCRTAVAPGDKTCMALRRAHRVGGHSARKSVRARQ